MLTAVCDLCEALSVVVPTRDRPDWLDECLATVVASLRDDDELIVVDSCSHGGRTAAVADRHGARVLRAPSPGASLARNLGWRAARHGAVAFVDDDVRVAPHWAEALAAGLAAHPEASFLAGRIAAAPGNGTTEAPVALLDREMPSSIDGGSTGTIGHSANLTVRRKALEAVGGFDEMLGAGAPLRAAEDVDLLDRLLVSGLTGRYEPSALAWHLQWRRRSDLLRLYWAYGIGQGARLTKLARADRRRARREARIAVWDRGLADLGRDLLRSYEFGAILRLIHLAGLIVGAARAELRRGAAPPRPPARH